MCVEGGGGKGGEGKVLCVWKGEGVREGRGEGKGEEEGVYACELQQVTSSSRHCLSCLTPPVGDVL